MNLRLRSLLLASFAIGLSGCELPKAGIPSLQLPTYEQSRPVKVFDTVQISIQKSYWTDSLEKPGFASLPQQFREQQRHLYTTKAKSKFLVVETLVTNTGNQPAQWNRYQVPIFSLESATGSRYVTEPDDINPESLVQTILMGRGTLNPGGSLTGKVVFDVPPGSYQLNFALATELQTGGVFAARRNLFRWNLSPTGER